MSSDSALSRRDEPQQAPDGDQRGRGRFPMIHATTWWVAVVGVAVTAGLSLAAWSIYNSNEDRLLQQRTREAAAVLTAVVPSIQTPLVAASEVVLTAAGSLDSESFERLMTPLVTSGRPYVSASVWKVPDTSPRPLLVVGTAPKLAGEPAEAIRSFLDRSAANSAMSVLGLLNGDNPRLGYAYVSPPGSTRVIVYGEAALPVNRTAVVRTNMAFSGLNNAVYLGTGESAGELLTASTPDLPLRGRRATETIPFGNTSLLLVMSPVSPLGGGLIAILPSLVAGVGLLTTFGAGLLTERLLRRRDHAELLADDNAVLYRQQRSVADTLQHSLLPEFLPVVAGLDLAVRYQPGTLGLEVGGDWYDVIQLSEHRLLIVVGDVSGRGVKAATVMASLRYSIRAFASLGDPPEVIMTRLGALLDVCRDGHFATVLCAVVDVDAHELTIVNAGHPHPILIDGAIARGLPTSIGLPVGVSPSAVYQAITLAVPAKATVVVFTDGLFERRGETVDDGIERLRRAASIRCDSLDALLSHILVVQGEAADDSAILGMQWQN